MEAIMRRLLIGLLACGLFLAAPLFAQTTQDDEEARIRRAASSAENAIAVRQCIPQATELRDIAAAARAERRAVVRAALLESIDNRDRALASCRDGVAPRRVRGRMLSVIGAEMESGFGVMDMSPLLAQFTERQPELLACYERMLSRRLGASGRVAIEVTVREDGRIDGVQSVENTLGDPAVAECLERVVRGFRAITPGPTGGEVTYRFPLEFEYERAM
jgi:TonB family protein